MSKKMEYIKNLKHKLAEMQRELEELEGPSSQHSPAHSPAHSQLSRNKPLHSTVNCNSVTMNTQFARSPSSKNNNRGWNPAFGK
jgi:hypothetical protein